MSDFCHLHLHTEYSLLDGVSKIKPLLDKAKANDMNACALTDHGVLYGTFEFWSYAREIGIKPILGCEVYVATGSRKEKKRNEDGKNYFHLTLLAKNREGYSNLVKLVSLGHKEGFYYKPRVDRELLEQYSKGLICLTGCPGSPINQALLKGDLESASNWMGFLGNNFDDLYFELMRSDIKELAGLESKQIEFNKKYKLPFVATVDSHYIEPDDFRIQEIAWCIADGRQLNDESRRQYGSREFYMKNPQQMSELFADRIEAVENTTKIADMVEEYKITYDRVQPKYYNIPAKQTSQDVLKEMVYAKALERYPELTEDLKKRIEYELEVIHNKGYNDYFLVVQDYINWAREHDILVGPGRGSGAGSVVAYILGIVNIDPLRWALIFERFLNPERDSPPDFDIDFQDDKRDQIFKYMSERYGQENTAHIGTFGRLKTKAAIRDVARVMGIDLKIADKLSKMVIVKFGRVHTIDMMMKDMPEFKVMIDNSPELQELCGYVKKLENISRHVSTHACGFLVTPEPIINYVPIQKESKGGDKIVTQVEGGPIEYLGLMKFDFLGLSNLTIIKNALKQIEYNRKKTIDINTIPLDDDKTFELFRNGNTTAVFQFESDGMKKYLRDLQPTNMEDLFFLNAAYRPGPMKYIPDYIARKKGEQQVTYLHPSLEPILKSTFGFAIYQEQVMQIAVDFAGYSLGQADMLRRAMGKKKPEIMVKEKQVFIERAVNLKRDSKVAEAIFAYLEPFADYGFNRSHSACYSLIAYQTAYLKANYPLEFMAGLMQTNLGNAEKISRDLEEAKEMGIKVLPPDVNESFTDFKIEKNKFIRFGLGGIKSSSEKIMENIVKDRIKNGHFKNVDDLIIRVGFSNLSKKDLECLIKVGALDKFGKRNQLLAVMPIAFENAQITERKRAGGQTGIFAAIETSHENTATAFPSVKTETDQERIAWEKEMLGTFLTSHPLERYMNVMLSDTIIPVNKIDNKKEGEKIQVLAIIASKKVIFTKKSNKPMAFVVLEDLLAKIEGVVFPDTYKQIQETLIENKPFIISGTVNKREEGTSLLINSINEIADVPKISKYTINITSETNRENIEKLKDLISKNPGKVELNIIYGNALNTKMFTKKINPTPKLMEAIKHYKY
ncbi:DNA polymerase III subunit alpha [Candidatus Dojkabacteria bacterium]|nr:DNA polymerase III subunit alpha [Candidatus Dojkabacteria bacterium]